MSTASSRTGVYVEAPSPISEWFYEAGSHQIAIGPVVNEEADENLHRCFLSDEPAGLVALEDIQAFLDYLISDLSDKLVTYHGGHKMVLYLWHDKMAGSLCWSLVTLGGEMKLPFQREVHIVDTVDSIANEFLGSPYLGGIPFEDLDMTDEVDQTEPSIPQPVQPLKVFATYLPLPC